MILRLRGVWLAGTETGKLLARGQASPKESAVNRVDLLDADCKVGSSWWCQVTSKFFM